MRYVPPTFQRLRNSAPFHVTWLPSLNADLECNFENAKTSRKMHFSIDFRRFKFQNILGGTCPRILLADLHLGTGATVNLLHHTKSFVILIVLPPDNVSSSLPETLLKCPSIHLPLLL